MQKYILTAFNYFDLYNLSFWITLEMMFLGDCFLDLYSLADEIISLRVAPKNPGRLVQTEGQEMTTNILMIAAMLKDELFPFKVTIPKTFLEVWRT